MKWLPRHSSLTAIIVGFSLLYYFFKKDALLIPVTIAFLGFVIQSLGEWIHLCWMKISQLLGKINSTILLSLLFYIILTPIAWMTRLFGKINMRNNPKNKKTSFAHRNHRYTEADLKYPW